MKLKLKKWNPRKTNAEQGLYEKFRIERTDGSHTHGGKHYGCQYFVLDLTHDQHARPSLIAYAKSCAATHPELSADLFKQLGLTDKLGAALMGKKK